MNLNATLLGQMIAFALFVWFCWKFVWPPLLAAMEERAKKIEQGLKDSEASAKKIVEAEEESKKMLAKAKSLNEIFFTEVNSLYLANEIKISKDARK